MNAVSFCIHCKYLFVLMIAEKLTAIQLRGPSSTNGTGRVEIFYNGQWGTICDDGWDINDARVVCRELGYQDVARALHGNDVPDGRGPIWLDNVACVGNEKTLGNCTHRGWGKHDCSHWEDAGVECSSTSKLRQIKLIIWEFDK